MRARVPFSMRATPGRVCSSTLASSRYSAGNRMPAENPLNAWLDDELFYITSAGRGIGSFGERPSR
jgi:hypothetical protein